MPKPICSPARPAEPNKRHHNHHHHLKKSSNRGGQGSQLLWAKSKPMSSEISEPTSPKVTCAGQIKVRPKPGSCKNWQSVMEEIERIHKNRKQKKRPTWIEALGFKKEVNQFLTCLRRIRFDLRCFGSFPTESNITTDDDEEDEEENEVSHGDHQMGTVFSKWFMVLQENQNNEKFLKEKRDGYRVEESEVEAPSVPPPNALLLMRCRSAPAKSWLEEREEEEEEEKEKEEQNENEDEDEERVAEEKKEKLNFEEEKNRRKKESVVVMRYDTDFYRLSSDIAKETWVVGGIRDPLSRSKSWKR
ncbi:hypothetical protein RJ641_031676 [Dillenia turbinata]|uniref:Uncharacterized protein n=1 Tax=Dillenia turbinata TaxID=194707 RepID=A0AAN8VN88_9MAGN